MGCRLAPVCDTLSTHGGRLLWRPAAMLAYPNGRDDGTDSLVPVLSPAYAKRFVTPINRPYNSIPNGWVFNGP